MSGSLAQHNLLTELKHGNHSPFPNALDYNSVNDDGYALMQFPSGIELTDLSFLYTFREILMMRVMNTITDKPDWDRKVCRLPMDVGLC